MESKSLATQMGLVAAAGLGLSLGYDYRDVRRGNEDFLNEITDMLSLRVPDRPKKPRKKTPAQIKKANKRKAQKAARKHNRS